MLHTKRVPRSLNTLFVLLFLLTSLHTVSSYTRRPARARPQAQAAGQTVQPRQAEDPVNKSYFATLKDGKVVKFSADSIPESAFTTRPGDRTAEQEADKEPQREKIHPALKKRIAQLAKDETETLLVNFLDDVEMPRFPQLRVDEPRTSAANAQALEHAGQLIQQIKERRRGGYEKLLAELRGRYRAEVVETFWLLKAVLVKMPLSSIAALAERGDVSFISPRNSGAPHPGRALSLNNIFAPLGYLSSPLISRSLASFDANPNNDVQDGRARIMSDFYLNQGLSGGYIGLLDTGVRVNHTQFTNPSRIRLFKDCFTGDDFCNGGSGVENPNCDHGTSSAAILSANANQGNAYHGVTGITLDSFKVYSDFGFCGGAEVAVVRGFQAALAAGDQVIVAEVAFPTSDTSAISVAADKAFDAGAVVVAAAGNDAGVISAPANAHKVIGVGAYNVETLAPFAQQNRGPALDGRIKPDIVTPTDTETAGNASDTALRVHIKTSGATPYAGGAAALLRNWLARTSSTNDPGQVYAWMILSGQKPYPFDNITGAGRLTLPTNGGGWWGKTQIYTGKTVELPWPLAGVPVSSFDAAIWWPESASQRHVNLDLSLIDPNGVVRATSTSIPSVFERVRATGALPSGTWKLRIQAHTSGSALVPSLQKFYWAAYVRSS